MWRHSFRFSMTVMRRRYVFASLCVVCMSSLVCACRNASSRVSAHASTQVVVTQTVEETIPDIDGSWDLMWKGSTKQLQKVKICVKQNGTRLVIRSEGTQSMRLKKNSSGSGLVTPHRISFTLAPRGAGEMVFAGDLQDGILCGTTNTGLPWMAIRYLD